MAMATPNTVIKDDTGTYIPATQRPDGSWRKARRVKDGYIPQDEMPLYESKGKQWAKNRPTLPVGLDPCYSIPQATKNGPKKIPGLSDTAKPSDATPKTSSSKKKKKKKDDTAKIVPVTNMIEKMDINSTKTDPVSATVDPAKRIRNLKKKLRDINALKLKIESGELANPEKDQLEKIARKGEIEAEIEELELELEE
ncbi:hypothetical protein JTE90_002165 [Oedothorax gibbosus]|uniref:Partner of Y14 and mago n=1 Tax=Oedothorax gibbosus TaxID=931172 RepID=A0AAV6V6I3_9ARAC|nr:hypothetical protein JTE90_002165 [Oedothorax gibbosus]